MLQQQSAETAGAVIVFGEWQLWRDGFRRQCLPCDYRAQTRAQPFGKRARFHLLAVCCLGLICGLPRVSLADGLPLPCGQCDLMVGVGTTYFDFRLTHGLVLPIALEFDQSRWELGAFRFANSQEVNKYYGPSDGRGANPYWGFTAMRRWQVLHRGWGKIYLGFGANYRTESDYLEISHWNFAYLIAARFDVGLHGTALEVGIRHWSDAWIRRPNRGQDLATLSVVF
jgi:Lipid A 3-O-deacylase (PagL)